MELTKFIELISLRRQTIILFAVIGLSVALLATIIQPLKYATREKLLVVQNYSAGTDPYAFSKSNEYLSGILAEVISSNSFFNRVINSGFAVDRSYFEDTVKKQMDIWQETVSARAVNDTGIIEIEAYHPNKQQAEQIALAVMNVMKTQHQFYHGQGEEVTIKTLDDPVTSSWPVKPNIILNLILGFALGLIVGLSYIYLLPEEKYSLRIMPRAIKLPAAGLGIEYTKTETNRKPELNWKAASESRKEPANFVRPSANYAKDDLNLNGDIGNLL